MSWYPSECFCYKLCPDCLCLTLAVWLTDVALCFTCGLHRCSYKEHRDNVTQALGAAATAACESLLFAVEIPKSELINVVSHTTFCVQTFDASSESISNNQMWC